VSIIAPSDAGWVYRITWQWPTHAAAAGLSLVLAYRIARRHITLRMRLHLVLPLIAILLSTGNAYSSHLRG